MEKTKLKIFSVIIIISISLSVVNCSKKKKKKLYGFVTINGLNLRNNARGKIIGKLRIGEKVVVMARTQEKHVVNKMKDYWYKIATPKGKIGWVFAGYIQLEGEKQRQKKLVMQKRGNPQDFNHYLYIANEKSNNIGIYKITDTGKLKFISNQKAIKKPVSVTSHPFLNYIYVLEFTRIITYKIRQNGSLEPIGTLKIGTGGKVIKTHPNGKFVYASMANPMINIGMYKVMADGRLKGMGDVFTFKKPTDFDITQDGRFAYFYDRKKKNQILKFSVAINGKLNQAGETNINPGKYSGVVALSPAGKMLVVSNVPAKSLVVYKVMPDGGLDKETVIKNAGNAGDLLFNEKGTRLYVTDKLSGNINIYSIKDNALTKIKSIKTGKMPEEMVMHQSGKYLFVADKRANKTFVYKITDSGLEKTQEIATGLTPEALCIGRVKKIKAK